MRVQAGKIGKEGRRMRDARRIGLNYILYAWKGNLIDRRPYPRLSLGVKEGLVQAQPNFRAIKRANKRGMQDLQRIRVRKGCIQMRRWRWGRGERGEEEINFPLRQYARYCNPPPPISLIDRNRTEQPLSFARPRCALFHSRVVPPPKPHSRKPLMTHQDLMSFQHEATRRVGMAYARDCQAHERRGAELDPHESNLSPVSFRC